MSSSGLYFCQIDIDEIVGAETIFIKLLHDVARLKDGRQIEWKVSITALSSFVIAALPRA